METQPKQSPFTSLKNGVAQHKTKILTAVAVTSVTLNFVQARGIGAHNAFLKEHGLFEQFYNISPTPEA